MKPISIMVILLIALPLQAEIYRWTDAAGKVHFSDKPVSDKAKEVKIKVSPANPQSPQDIQNRKSRTEQYLRGRQEERAEQDKKIKEKKKLKKEQKRKCKNAQREHLRIVRSRTIYYKGENGARNYIGDDERTKIIARAKAEVKKWCK